MGRKSKDQLVQLQLNAILFYGSALNDPNATEAFDRLAAILKSCLDDKVEENLRSRFRDLSIEELVESIALLREQRNQLKGATRVGRKKPQTEA